MKRVGILDVSLRGLNFRFGSHLGCSGENAIVRSLSYVAVKVSFGVSRE